MANRLEELLASSGPAIAAVGQATNVTVSQRYTTDQLWNVAARAYNTIEGANIYPGRDGNQLCYISTRPPGQNARRGEAPAKSVTVYKQGAVNFVNVAAIEGTEFTEAEKAAGQLLAEKCGMLSLSDEEKASLGKIVAKG